MKHRSTSYKSYFNHI